MIMTSSDLSGMMKPFELVHEQVLLLHEEFWTEGDQRKSLNLPCIAMMDRDQRDCLPKGQLDFYNFIMVRCFGTLARILPNCSSMERDVQRVIDEWKKLDEKSKEVFDENNQNDESKSPSPAVD